MMETEQFQKNIKKTGYLLEYQVSSLLQHHGWIVINNKYYVDDVQGGAREIDIIAYKATAIQGFHVYTSLIISCKKDEENAWALLAKNIDKKDPNTNWTPLHLWSNDDILKYMLDNTAWQQNYLTKNAEIYETIFSPKSHIFAFQEMSKNSGKPQNDKKIFSSVSSLMKSQGYELTSLSKRKKEKSLYCFNLLSVVDSDLLKLNFRGEKIDTEPINDAKYVGNYIINKSETSSRIHFINADALKIIIKTYNKLHEHDVSFFNDLYDSYFPDACKTYNKSKVLIKKLDEMLRRHINWALLEEFKWRDDVGEIDIWWHDEKELLHIETIDNEEYIEFLNSNDKIKEKTASILKDLYRFEGPFVFSEKIPF